MSFATTNAVDFVNVEDQVSSRWLHACQAQFAAQASGKGWTEAATAWAELAKACPSEARRDVAIYWTLAGEAAEKARRKR